MSADNTAQGGVGFAGLLTVAFIVLKLCNVIDWSWWWVLSPAWISLSLCLFIFVVVVLVVVCSEYFKKRKAVK